MFLFHASYEQTTANDFTPIPLPLPISSQANFTDMGLGTYAQGTITFRDKLSLSAGLRWDYETKAADTRTTWPLFSGRLNHDTEFHQLTPQAAIRYQFNPTLMSYFSFSGGYKAGGFNALGPVIYDQERSWNYEFGVKGRGLHNKLGFGIAAFYTDWKNMQLNQFSGPSPTYIQNVGNTQTHGLEMNLDYKLHRWISVFSSASWQDTSFLQGAVDSGANISGNRLPYAPKYNFTLGALLSVPLDNGLSLYARADIQTVGSFNYSAQNTAAQDAYTLANFRLGVKQNGWFAEAYVNNAFNTEYIPIALPYESASGFIGENAAPLTMGIRMGIRF